MTTTKKLRKPTKPNLDYGFFGPDSVSWKVFQHPVSFTIGFHRTVITEMFEPYLLASVKDTDAVMSRPSVRYDRTLQYVSTVTFADSETAVNASNTLFRIHSHIRGIEPISGGQYDANAPEAQLWIHLTQWHSVLLTYEMLGPGKLSPEEEEQYWAECRRAAEFQTIDPDTVPRNRKEMREYYERMRPILAATEETQDIVHHLLDASAFLMDDLSAVYRPFKSITRELIKKTTIATMPRWLRRMAGVQQSALTDAAAILGSKAVLKVSSMLPERQQLFILKRVSPGAAKVLKPILLGKPPINAEVLEPEEAFKKAGFKLPREQYQNHLKVRPITPPKHAPRDPGAEHLLQLA